MNGDVVLVVGNGLSIDLRQTFLRLRRWDTSNPLSWEVSAPRQQGARLLDRLDYARRGIREAQEQAALTGTVLSDFALFDAVLQSSETTPDSFRTLIELRHLLALSFASYQLHADRFVTSNMWAWGRYLRSIRHRLLGVVSFNYDLNVESILELDGPVWHLAVAAESGDGLPIAKPHGSIDYAPTENAIWTDHPPTYPIRIWADNNDVPIRRLPRHDLQVPRLEADIVVPTEASQYTDFQWVRPGRQWIKSAGERATALVLVGMSYWKVDRREIDEILLAVKPSATVVIANPSPSSELLDVCRARFDTVVEWREGPEELPRTRGAM